MIDKDTLRDAMLKECDIAKHLFGKIPEGGLVYRPSDGQRDMLELLRYLSFCGIGGCRAMVDGNWDGYQEVAQRAEDMAAEEFPAAMDRQKEELAALLDGLDDEKYRTADAPSPMGTMPLWQALFTMSFRWLSGYRMQLFLYCKAAGATDISTPNCWEGIDWPQPDES